MLSTGSWVLLANEGWIGCCAMHLLGAGAVRPRCTHFSICRPHSPTPPSTAHLQMMSSGVRCMGNDPSRLMENSSGCGLWTAVHALLGAAPTCGLRALLVLASPCGTRLLASALLRKEDVHAANMRCVGGCRAALWHRQLAAGAPASCLLAFPLLPHLPPWPCPSMPPPPLLQRYRQRAAGGGA